MGQKKAVNPSIQEEIDKQYNEYILKIRKSYEEKILEIQKKYRCTLINGDAYYGDQKPGTNIYKRPDSRKEYVKDMRGTFIPRYVRRELNRCDNTNQDINPTGNKTYRDLYWHTVNKTHGQYGIPLPGGKRWTDTISWPHREFQQQSSGGGENQYAFSHTSTKRPILSNAHKSFGEYQNGAIITDLSKIPTGEIAAQWRIDPNTGHKAPLIEGTHQVIGSLKRDKKVIQSGYRNMEVVTKNIPRAAISATWSKDSTDTYMSYMGGESIRGNQLVEYRREQAL